MKKIKSLSFSYDDKTVLSDFTFELEDKGLYVITGPSGTGKSTLLRIICGIEKGYSGTLTGFDNDVFSVSFQSPRLMEWMTARENVAAVLTGKKRECLKKADFWLDKLGLAEHKNKHPSELSGGQQQRVSLARALAKDCTVLLLDEPTTGLDDELSETVMNMIKKESESKLVIYVTHGEKEKGYTQNIINIKNQVCV